MEKILYNSSFKTQSLLGRKIRERTLKAYLNRKTQIGFCEQGFDKTCAKHICKQDKTAFLFAFQMFPGPLVPEPKFVNAHNQWRICWHLHFITFARLILFEFFFNCSVRCKEFYIFPELSWFLQSVVMSRVYRFNINFSNLQTHSELSAHGLSMWV